MYRKETSVVFYEDYSKDIFTTLSTEEINLFYELLEVAAQQFLGSYAKEFSIKIKKFATSYLRWHFVYTFQNSRSKLLY